MAIDLTGGLDPAFEYFLEKAPANPDVRDSASLWVMPDDPAIACPRITIDAIGEDWEHPWLQINLVLADGRALRVWTGAAAHPALDEAGKPSIRGAGPLRFQCLEPFCLWEVEYKGPAQQTTSKAQMKGEPGDTPANVEFYFTAEMAVPPWLMGGMNADTAKKMLADDAGEIMGGLRYEQLCRVNGFIRVDQEEYNIVGTGMRVRRQGVRNMGAAYGHCQHSALFPSGRGFGAIAMAPGPAGEQSFNEGFVFTGDGTLVPARVTKAPWMTQLNTHADDATLVLATELGEIEIQGETLMTTFDQSLFEMADSSVLQQGVARYRWDGEETVGLIERCSLRERLL